MCQCAGEYRIRKTIRSGGFQEEHRATTVLQRGNFNTFQGLFQMILNINDVSQQGN